jgi:uncharacterized protein YijF (DUF1287 family)
VAKPGSKSGLGKRSKRERGPAHDTRAFQRRIDRHHGGPPAHIVAKQRLELAARRDRRLIAAEAAKSVLAPVSEITVPTVIVPAVSVPVTAQASVPLIVSRLEAPRTSAKRATSAPAYRLAASLLMIPFVAAIAALIIPASPPAPGITAPTRVAETPLLTPHAIERRFVDMTPPVKMPGAGPALPGSIRLAALSLPTEPPEVPVIVPAAPLISLPQQQALVWPTLPPLPEPPALAPAPVPAIETSHQCQPAPVEQAVIETPPREAMGAALAAAALKQTTQFVVYNARYTRIAYPGGDVSSLEGVCTDVIIRAYRALGIDLQQIVHESRIGTGDTSIDHRRTETLRKFLSMYGESVPVTDFIENFQPGDIVTYYRPQNRTSTAHIAIVSDVIAPSGRPMIIHNRGLGVQLEDALFVDKITGHYRYSGPADRTVVATSRMQTSALPSRVAGIRAAAKSPAAAKLALRAQSAPLNPRP